MPQGLLRRDLSLGFADSWLVFWKDDLAPLQSDCALWRSARASKKTGLVDGGASRLRPALNVPSNACPSAGAISTGSFPVHEARILSSHFSSSP